LKRVKIKEMKSKREERATPPCDSITRSRMPPFPINLPDGQARLTLIGQAGSAKRIRDSSVRYILLPLDACPTTGGGEKKTCQPFRWSGAGWEGVVFGC